MPSIAKRSEWAFGGRLGLFLAAVLWIGAPFAVAQKEDPKKKDPLAEQKAKAMQELSSRETLQKDPAFLEAQSRWPEIERQIRVAEREQDDALSGTIEQTKTIVELFRSRAVQRNAAVDHHLLGRVLGLRNDLDGAYEHFKAALAIDSYFYWSWDGIGVYFNRKERYQEAADAFMNALRINPAFARSTFGLCQAYLRLNRFTEAKRVMTDALANPDLKKDADFMTRAHMHLAEIYRNEQNFGAAIDELSQIIDQKTTDILVYAMRADCERKLERFADAVTDYQKILEIAPKEWRYLLPLANCLERVGRNADSANELERYLEAAEDLSPEMSAQIRARIGELRKRKPVDNPKNARLGLADWINRLMHSAEEKRRQEAILMLSTAPMQLDSVEATRKVNEAFLRALLDKDKVVRTKAVEQVGLRLWWKEDMVKIWAFLVADPEPDVRAMTHFVLPRWKDEHGQTLPSVVPYLMKGIDDADVTVFKQAHESLNQVTLAFIERVLPMDLTPEFIAATKKKWHDWYEKNRDAYRKYEPK